jgi:glyceraldehyde 3-phosphate dehydrogenase (phosphorylating)
MKAAINGLGRIGRMVLRHAVNCPPGNLEIVAVNDLTPVDELAYLMRYDSVHGKAGFPVEFESGKLRCGSHELSVLSEKDPGKLPWRNLEVDIVLECTGLFRSRAAAARHIDAGAKKVIISAPSDDVDLTVVLGVNENLYDPAVHHVISNASCTTNSLAPAAKVLNDAFGVEYLLATTVHAYTASQSLVDKAMRKRRRGRAGALSLIPTTTGAAEATIRAIPELKGKMDAIAIRAPVPDGAITDIVAHLRDPVTVESVVEAFRKAAAGPMKGILACSEEELVSADIIGDPHSGIFDSPSTRVVGGHAVKVLIWYDNEYGYAARMIDLSRFIAGRG